MWKRLVLVTGLLIVPMTVPMTAASGDDDFDFDKFVGQVERHYGRQRLHVPFLGLASFLGSGIARPFGASGMKVAIIEGIDRSDGVFAPQLGGGWRPVIRVSRRGQEETAIFGRDEGKWVKLLTLTQDGGDAVVVQFRLRPSMLMEFIASKARGH